MEEQRKHIDNFFRDELDGHEEPLTGEELELFSELTSGKKRPFLNPKYIKWLPYLAGLSAAAAIGYVSKPLFVSETILSEKNQPEKVVVIDEARKIDSVTAIAPLNYKPFDSTNSQQKTFTALQIILPESNTVEQREENNALQKLGYRKENKTITIRYNNAPLISNKLNFPSFSEVAERVRVTVMLGFESGISTPSISSGVLGVQMKYQVSSKVHVGIMPTVKIGQSSSINLSKPNTLYANYYEGVGTVENQSIPGTFDYQYFESYDSISVVHQLDRNIWEVELPVFWEYNISQKISLQAGIKFMYGKVPQIVQNATTHSQMYTDSLVALPFLLPKENAISFFQPNCNCISDDISSYRNPSRNILRTGYLIGASYAPNEKVSLNISMHQNASDLSHIPNSSIRQLYNVTQFRLSFGYTIGKAKK